MMRWFFLFLSLSLFATDFDCILIGSSPFSLFEALYQYHSGKKVLILEEAPVCGGAWKGIDICGLSHVDLGCHHIVNDTELKQFLETYTDCHIVSMDNPLTSFDKDPNGWYFSRGCYELIENLLKQIAATDIVLLTETRAENIEVNSAEKIATVQTEKGSFTTQKVIVTPMSYVSVNGSAILPHKSRYFHLYLLIQDPTSPRFTYQKGKLPGLTRVMNLTYFVGLKETGRQLVVVQAQAEKRLSNPQEILDLLKENHWIDEGAYLLRAEPFVYETGTFNQALRVQGIVELLKTGHLKNLAKYIPKWKLCLKKL
jgi:hypothetical protein